MNTPLKLVVLKRVTESCAANENDPLDDVEIRDRTGTLLLTNYCRRKEHNVLAELVEVYNRVAKLGGGK